MWRLVRGAGVMYVSNLYATYLDTPSASSLERLHAPPRPRLPRRRRADGLRTRHGAGFGRYRSPLQRGGAEQQASTM